MSSIISVLLADVSYLGAVSAKESVVFHPWLHT